jgi:hypothetical protein
MSAALKHNVLHDLLIALVLSSASVVAAEEPPDTVFHSTYEFNFRIPPSFKPTGGKRGYLDTPAGKAPYFDQVWRAEKDLIMIRAFVVPEVSWQAPLNLMFAGAKENMLTDPNLKLVSERDYKVGDCPAHSFIFSHEGDDTHFERMDYIVTKPDLNIVDYVSPTKASLENLACKELFESISVRPKAANK